MVQLRIKHSGALAKVLNGATSLTGKRLRSGDSYVMEENTLIMKRIVFAIICMMFLTCSACGQEDVSSSGDNQQDSIAVSDAAEETANTAEGTAAESPDAAEGTEEAEKTTEGTVGLTDGDEGTFGEEAEPEQVSLKDLAADYFTVGVGINGSTLENQTLNMPEYMALCKEQFNSCTMTNLMKSCYILDQSGSKKNLENGDGSPALKFDNIDPTLQWCQENGMKMRGHTLVWHTQAPEWFFREGYDDGGEYVGKEVMLARMESYIAQLLTHVQENYPGVVYCWDVVNEAVDPDNGDKDSGFMCRRDNNGTPNPWYETIGPDYVKMAFTYARKYAAEDVKLFYNDFNTYMTPKRKAIYALCESLKEEGLIDGIGMQGYWGISYPGLDVLDGTIRRFAKLDLELHITELSIGVDEETEEQFKKQGNAYKNVFNMLLKADTAGGGPANITNVTFFGLKDHYRDGDKTNSRLYDKDYQPKPAYDAVVSILKSAAKRIQE